MSKLTEPPGRYGRNYKGGLITHLLGGGLPSVPAGSTLSYLSTGLFSINPASNCSDIPSEYGTSAVVAIRLKSPLSSICTILIDTETNHGIYTRYSDGSAWNKQ